MQRKFVKCFLRPIPVYCFHQVSAEYNPLTMWECDWTQIDQFKRNIMHLKESGVKFISLQEAHAKLKNDRFRCKRYAVLSADDGYKSLLNILPWLEEQKIPVTLFINGKYLDGKSYRHNPKEKYLLKAELWALTSPLIEIGHHGWEHNRVSEMTEAEFEKSVELNVNLLQVHPNYVPFWAYTYGDHTQMSDEYLRAHGIVPIYIDGVKNYNNHDVIHRELLV